MSNGTCALFNRLLVVVSDLPYVFKPCSRYEMSTAFESFGTFAAGVTVVAAISGGFVMSVFHYFVMKRIVRPVREGLAVQVGDPARRRGLVTRFRWPGSCWWRLLASPS